MLINSGSTASWRRWRCSATARKWTRRTALWGSFSSPSLLNYFHLESCVLLLLRYFKVKSEDGLGRVGGTAAVYCAAILEYLTAEVCLHIHSVWYTPQFEMGMQFTFQKSSIGQVLITAAQQNVSFWRKPLKASQKVLELAGNAAKDLRVRRISPRHLQLAIRLLQ